MGKMSDKIGKKITLFAGYFIYGIVYLCIGLSNTGWTFWIFFALYGVYTALTAGCERALVADIAPKNLKGSVLGLHSAIVGIGLLPASVIAGFLWTYSEALPFIVGGTLGIISAVAFIIILSLKPKKLS